MLGFIRRPFPLPQAPAANSSRLDPHVFLTMAAVDDSSTAVRVIEAGVPLLALMGAGFVVAWRKWLPFADVNPRAPLAVLNAFVFTVGIPGLVYRGLALQDYWKFNWTFLGLFLVLRVICTFVAREMVNFHDCATWHRCSLCVVPVAARFPLTHV